MLVLDDIPESYRKVIPRILSLLTAFACFGLPQLCAQTSASPSPVPVLELNARAVAVDIVVTGKHSRPVTGLHKEDFEVLEDGHPQQINDFEEHPGTPEPESIATHLPSNSFTNVPAVTPNGSLMILLLDSLNTPSADQARVRSEILKYLQNLKPGRPIAIFTLGLELHCIQGFTGDPSVLRAVALDAQKNAPPDDSTRLGTKEQAQSDSRTVSQILELGDSATKQAAAKIAFNLWIFQKTQASLLDSGRELDTLAAFRQLAHYLSGIPGRKSVAWFSGAFPYLFVSYASLNEPFAAQRDYSDVARATDAALVAAQVAIYPISAAGLANNTLYDADTQLTGHSASDTQMASHQILSDDGKVRSANQSSMDEIAQATGGEAFHDSNALADAIDKIAEDGSHYYTLFYTPSNPAPENHYRQITVKLAHGHYKLAYNREYFAADRNTSRTAAIPAGGNPLSPFMSPDVLDSTQIPFVLRVNPASPALGQVAVQPASASTSQCTTALLKLARPSTCYSFEFVIAASGLNFERSSASTQDDSLDVMLAVFSKEGKPLNGITSKLNLKLDAAHYAKIQADGVHLNVPLAVPRDAVSVRGGVYDWNSGPAGTLGIQLASVIAASSSADTNELASSPAPIPAEAVTKIPANPGPVQTPVLNSATQIISAAPSTDPSAVSPQPVLPALPPGHSAPAVFWALPTTVLNKMLASPPAEDAARYARLRDYFTSFGCKATHLSAQPLQKQSGRNLICLLPGTDSKTIVLTARYEHRTIQSAQSHNWDSAILLATLYHALQAEQRHYTFVFAELYDDNGEKQFLDSLASTDVTSLAAMVALDIPASGTLHFALSPSEVPAPMQGLTTEDETLRERAIQNGDHANGILSLTLLTSARLNRVPQPVNLSPSRAVENSRLVRRSTYIPSILIYTQTNAHNADSIPPPSDASGTERLVNLLSTYLCGLDTNLVP